MSESPSIAEKILLCPPRMIEYYRIRYKLYMLLDLSFDLFLTEDIYNYINDLYVCDLNQSRHRHYSRQVMQPIFKYFPDIDNINSSILISEFTSLHDRSIDIIHSSSNHILLDFDHLSLLHTMFFKSLLTNKQINIIKEIQHYFNDCRMYHTKFDIRDIINSLMSSHHG